MTEPKHISVAFERIQRMVDILSMVSIGEHDPDLIHIEPSTEPDDFSVLEAALNIYNQELAAARKQNELHIAEMEKSRHELQEQLSTIARQQQAIHEMSTPIVEVWEDIVLLPIVGMLDSQRATEMTEKLLDRVRQSRSRCIIIDITGVELVDTTTANAMLKMTRAARLLGTMCVLTGIRPEIARTMVQLGIELEGIKTVRSLKDGLRECFSVLETTRRRDEASRRTENNGALSLLQGRRTNRSAKANADSEPLPQPEQTIPAPSSTSLGGD